MACTERCLTGLLAALVILMIAAALRSPVETAVARAVIELPAPMPRPALLPAAAEPAAFIPSPAILPPARLPVAPLPEVAGLQMVAFQTTAAEMTAVASDAVVEDPGLLRAVELAAALETVVPKRGADEASTLDSAATEPAFGGSGTVPETDPQKAVTVEAAEPDTIAPDAISPGPGTTDTMSPGADAPMVSETVVEASPTEPAAIERVEPAAAMPAAVTDETAEVASAPAEPVPDAEPAVDSETAPAAPASRPTAQVLSEAFDSLGYDLKSVGGGDRVPRLFVTNVPTDMESIPEVQMRKTVFLKTVLPLILQVNEEIAQERQLLWRLYYKNRLGVNLRAAERQWLQTMAERYAVDDADIEDLLRKVDIIPPSLALAQAAEESGWGTSRLARDSNALFGEVVYVDGKGQQYRSFDSLLDAVRGYARNLNAHRAYREFRSARRTMRQRGKPLDGHALAGFILRYSERGEGYIKTLRLIMSANDLRDLDGAELNGELTVDAELSADPAI